MMLVTKIVTSINHDTCISTLCLE